MSKFNNFKIGLVSLLLSMLSLSAFAATPEALEQHAKQFQLGMEQVREGDAESALKTWQTLYDSGDLIPELKRALQNNIAVILIKQRHYEQAKKHLDKALNEDRQVATTIANLNKLYTYDAQQAYRKVFKDTKVTPPVGELLYFDIKRASIPNDNVITSIEDADSIQLVKQATEAWRKAWSNQDVESYLSFYDDHDFIPRKGMSISAWKRSRYPSVNGPKFIKIQTNDIEFVPVSKDMVRVSFYQRYHSDRFKDDINKVLLWQRKAGQWKIIQEIVIYGKA